jgi:hypothetical protein
LEIQDEEPMPPFAVSERMVKALVLQFLVAWGKGDFAAAAACLEPSEEFSEKKLADLHKQYIETHKELRLDSEGRSNKHTEIKKTSDTWEVTRMLQDYDEQNDWQIVFAVDLARSKREERLVVVCDCLNYDGQD